MQRQQVLVNAIMSLFQIVATSIILFILYRFLIKTIGVEQLGIWSLILAATSLAQIANFGLSGSVVGFVAKYDARKEYGRICGVIQTATISVAIFAGVILLIGYPLIKWALGLVIPSTSMSFALSILPYSFVALWLMLITSVFQATLDGFQRTDIRSIILIGDGILYLILCFSLAPNYGLMGVAYARVLDNFGIMVISWMLIRKYSPSIPILPYAWNKILFKEIIGYGLKFQVISVTAMLYDPTTKALLAKFGGLSAVGYYEMVTKLILQFRALIVSANQVLVPTFAALKERVPQKIHMAYLCSYRLLFYLSVPLFALIIVSLPLISRIWIGYYEQTFIFWGSLLAIGWLLNIFNVPAYFAYIGIGDLRWNMISHVAIGILNITLGSLLGLLYDGVGVVFAWIVSLSLGSSIIYVSFHFKNNIPMMELIPKLSRKILIICAFGILTTAILYLKFPIILDHILSGEIAPLFLAVLLIPSLWMHPMRKKLIGLVWEVMGNK